MENPRPCAVWASVKPAPKRSRNGGCQYEALKSPMISVGCCASAPSPPNAERSSTHPSKNEIGVGGWTPTSRIGPSGPSIVMSSVGLTVSGRSPSVIGYRLHSAMPLAYGPCRSILYGYTDDNGDDRRVA